MSSPMAKPAAFIVMQGENGDSSVVPHHQGTCHVIRPLSSSPSRYAHVAWLGAGFSCPDPRIEGSGIGTDDASEAFIGDGTRAARNLVSSSNDGGVIFDDPRGQRRDFL